MFYVKIVVIKYRLLETRILMKIVWYKRFHNPKKYLMRL